MRDYLLFRLHGAMASWGETAVGDHRPSVSHPGRSAVLGLLAAAQGIRREEEVLLQGLADGYGLAVATDAAGVPLRDYHTVQAPPDRRKKIHRTRRDELADDKLNTIVSTRDYYTDVLHRVCLWVSGPDAPFSLQELAQALERPAFALYLGRKACPLALPMQPQVHSADSVRAAFKAAEFHDGVLSRDLAFDERTAFHWDDTDHAGMRPSKTFTRRDQPRSRSRWQFVARQENHLSERREEGENVHQ